MNRAYVLKFIFASFLTLAGLLILPELNASAEESVFSSGKWIMPDKNVKKIFDTGLGAVYEFPASPYIDLLLEKWQEINPQEISTIQIDLLDNGKRWKKLLRYIVLEFDIRLFPAMSKDHEPALFFSVTRSALPAVQIKKTNDLNGILDFDSVKHPFVLTTAYPKKKASAWNISSAAKDFKPLYRLTRCRIIFDSQSTEGLYSTNINGKKSIWKSYEKLPLNAIRSFGIMFKPPSKQRSKIRQRFFEISPPRFFMTENQSDLTALPEINIIEDIYETGQISPSETSKQLRNPDEIYALALQYLKGENLIEGIALLERAIKQRHVGAMYQLGLCYARGIGVEQDIPQALRYLRDAAEYGYPEALAWYPIIYIRATRPVEWTVQRQNSSDLSKFQRFCRDYPAMLVQENMILERFLGNTERWPLNRSNKIRFLLTRENKGKFYYAQHPSWNPIEAKKIKAEWPGLGLALTNSYQSNLEVIDYFWHECLQQSFVPTLLYQARLTALNGEKNALSEASALFSAGVDQGDLDCVLEIMLLDFRQKRLNKDQFNSVSDLNYCDHPLYEILKYAVNNPDDSGSRLLAQGKIFSAIDEWRQGKSAREKFLYGLGLIYSFYHYGFDSWIYRTTINDTRELKLAQTAFDFAANAELPEAQYWAAKMRFELDQTLQTMTENPKHPAGMVLLAQADTQGFIPASSRLLEEEFRKTGRLHSSKMQKLDELCEKTSSGRLWQLKGEVLLATSSKYSLSLSTAQTIFNAFSKAAQAGISRGYYQLGVCYYFGIGTKKNADQATRHWKIFIQMEQQKYLNDINDLTYKPIPPETVFCLPLQINHPENRINSYPDGTFSVSLEARKIYSTY